MNARQTVQICLCVFGIAGCGQVKDQYDKWVGNENESATKEGEKAKPDSMVRPADGYQGLLPEADQAVHAAQALHRQLYPGQRGDRVISAIKNHTGTVQIYLEEGKKKGTPATYWVGKKPQGEWHAYQEIPKHEDFDFVFKKIAADYLLTQHPDPVQIRDFWVGEGALERTVKMRYSTTEDIYTRKLTFKKDPVEGWSVVKEEPANSVYGEP